MIIYSTLKANKEHGISYWDIFEWCDMNWYLVADMFENSEKYCTSGDYTIWDKLCEDYSERTIASRILKYVREQVKKKENEMIIWNKAFIDLDCGGEIAFEQLKELIEIGEIKNSNDLNDICKKAARKNCEIKHEYYDNNNRFHRVGIDYLIDKYFPCQEITVIDDDGYEYTECSNCGNCG